MTNGSKRAPREVRTVMQITFPSYATVLAVVSNESHVTPRHIFKQGLRVESKVYIETLGSAVKPWIEGVAQRGLYIFQPDSAPCQIDHVVQDWLTEHLHDHFTPNMWPLNSSDVSPLDYYFWGVVERERQANEQSHNPKEALKTTIVDATANINEDHLIRACRCL